MKIENHPTQKNKTVNVDKYYGSDLNRLVGQDCDKSMMVMNIDLIINDYKNKNEIRIIESKHSNEKMGLGQNLLLKKLSKLGLKVFTVYGDEPFNEAVIYSFQSDKSKKVNKETLIKFLNNDYLRKN
jgi:hypothetical protein